MPDTLAVYPYPRLDGVVLIDAKGNIDLWNLRLTNKISALVKASELNKLLENNQKINERTTPTLSFYN